MSLTVSNTIETLKAPLMAKPQKAFAAAFVVFATVLAGCASGLGVNSYDSASVGMVTRVEEGLVIGVRAIDIEGGRQAAKAGAPADQKVGSSVTADTGFAYTVRLRTGELVSVAQGGAYPILEGTPVVIEYGARARVIPQNASIGYS